MHITIRSLRRIFIPVILALFVSSVCAQRPPDIKLNAAANRQAGHPDCCQSRFKKRHLEALTKKLERHPSQQERLEPIIEVLKKELEDNDE